MARHRYGEKPHGNDSGPLARKRTGKGRRTPCPVSRTSDGTPGEKTHRKQAAGDSSHIDGGQNALEAATKRIQTRDKAHGNDA
ncbi:hypothetical protein AZA_55888 [Nitrospirillum viridazoti Y2]|nr:hypothetical protein AZA_55888 [Nitrospirillum amazonense Y2]